MDISKLVKDSRNFFITGKTRDINFRINALKILKQSIKNNEELIISALLKDLNKPREESYLTELGMVYDEINYHIKHLRKWAKDRRVKTPITQFKSKSFTSYEPYGVVLIIAPWNYPIQLCFTPLVGSISAGNTSIIKPSIYAPNVSNIVNKIISETFSKDYIVVVEGGRQENSLLLKEKFDYIFFTGSVKVGKVVMEEASKNLTPVSLELGGKSPVIVEKSANIEISARRVCFGKMLNAGQTCVAPDYVMVDKQVKDEFIKCYINSIKEFFNGDYGNFPKIISDKHFDRLINLLNGEKVVYGSINDKNSRFIEPTIVEILNKESAIMQEEIFGPILPIIEYSDIKECIEFISSKPKPLALYLFTKDKKIEKLVLNSLSFGGGCINDTIIHLASPYMSFGGVGESGIGSYHGKQSFETFSHKRSVLKKSFLIDLKMRYRPYTKKKDKIIRKFLK